MATVTLGNASGDTITVTGTMTAAETVTLTSGASIAASQSLAGVGALTISTASAGDLTFSVAGDLKATVAAGKESWSAKTESNATTTGGINEAVTAGDLVCALSANNASHSALMDNSGVRLADNTNEYRASFAGVAVSAIAASGTGDVAFSGDVTLNKPSGGEKWTKGQPLYVGTSGRATNVAPSAAGTYEQQIGICMSDDSSSNTTAGICRLGSYGMVENT